MSTPLLEAAMSPVSLLLIKVSLSLGAAGVVATLARRRVSAATSHLIWSLALAVALLLPLASVALPVWSFSVGVAAPATSAVSMDDASPLFTGSDAAVSPAAAAVAAPTVAAPRAGLSWTTLLAVVYGIGVVLNLAALLVQRVRIRRQARQALDVADPAWRALLAECSRAIGVRGRVRLLRSREQSMPMTFGIRRPAILVPAIAETWTDDRRRAVLLHELAHVARHDCLTQTMALLVCSLYWFHPAVWWIARQLRIERELACDDRVIAVGTQPRDYAGHLLDIAYAFGDRRVSAMAVTMARPKQLESRMLAALDDRRNRTSPPLRLRAVGTLVAAAVVAGFAGATPTLDAAAPIVDPVGEMVGIPAEPAAPIQATPEDTSGTWELRPTEKEGVVHLRLMERNSQHGSNVAIDQLEGLAASQLTGAGGPVQFRIRRDAGTLVFEGVIRNRAAAGTFSFSPNASFPAELAKRGFAPPTAREQYQMARHDVGFAFIDELGTQGYGTPTTGELVRAGQHGVNTTYLREMGTLGYRLGSLDALITLRDHGVTPDYVRELAALGYKQLDADTVRNARDHGITPDYVRGLAEAGYRDLPLPQLVTLRDHGVTPDYVRELAALGYKQLDADTVRNARDHGVTPDFARGLVALGYTKLSLDDLVRIRDHGVTPDYAKALKALGYDGLAVDELVMLRDHGISPERIKAANERAGTRLPLDLLKSLR